MGIWAKIKLKIRAKVIKWLEIDDILVMAFDGKKTAVEAMELIEAHRNCLNDHTKKINVLKGQVRICEDIFKAMDGGLDLGQHQHKNWAVIAFKGDKNKQDFVKFIDLSNLNYKECFEWMKRLESLGVKPERFMYDAPIGIKERFTYPYEKGEY